MKTAKGNAVINASRRMSEGKQPSLKESLEAREEEEEEVLEESQEANNSEVEEVSEIDYKPEQVFKAKITKIQKGKLKAFIPEDAIIKKENAEREAYKIFFETDTGEAGSFIMMKSARPNSNLNRFISKYGRPPAVGMDIVVSYFTKTNGMTVLKPVM